MEENLESPVCDGIFMLESASVSLEQSHKKALKYHSPHPHLFRKRRLIYDMLFQVNIPSVLCILRKWAKPQN